MSWEDILKRKSLPQCTKRTKKTSSPLKNKKNKNNNNLEEFY